MMSSSRKRCVTSGRGSSVPAASILRSIGVVTVSTRRVVSVMFCDQSRSRCSSTLFAKTPMLAMCPPAATTAWQMSKAAGTPTASMATSTPRSPVRSITRRPASAPPPWTAWVAPSRCAVSRRLPSRATPIASLGEEERAEGRGAGADDGDGVAGLYLAVQDATLEACRQDVAQHHERLVLDVRGSDVEARVGEGDADVFGLRAVDRVAEHPAAVGAVGGHPAPAGAAGAVGADARDQHAVAGPDTRHSGTDLVDEADSLVPEHASTADRLHVSLPTV